MHLGSESILSRNLAELGKLCHYLSRQFHAGQNFLTVYFSFLFFRMSKFMSMKSRSGIFQIKLDEIYPFGFILISILRVIPDRVF
jgi:hypothetical protein